MVLRQLSTALFIVLLSVSAKAESGDIISESMDVLTQEHVDLSCQSKSVLIYKSYYVLNDIDIPNDCQVLVPQSGRLIIGRSAIVRFHGQIVADSRQQIFIFSQSGRALGFDHQTVSMAWFKTSKETSLINEETRRRVLEFGLGTDFYKVFIQGGTYLAKKPDIINMEEKLIADSSITQGLIKREVQSEKQKVLHSREMLNSNPKIEDSSGAGKLAAKGTLPWSKSLLIEDSPDLSSKSCHDLVL